MTSKTSRRFCKNNRTSKTVKTQFGVSTDTNLVYQLIPFTSAEDFIKYDFKVLRQRKKNSGLNTAIIKHVCVCNIKRLCLLYLLNCQTASLF